jgi:hypothetical protein
VKPALLVCIQTYADPPGLRRTTETGGATSWFKQP